MTNRNARNSKSAATAWILGGIAVALYTLAKRSGEPRATGWDKRYTAAFPPSEGAQNEVIGGHPEDMNAMPATGWLESDVPIHDGSILAKR